MHQARARFHGRSEKRGEGVPQYTVGFNPVQNSVGRQPLKFDGARPGVPYRIISIPIEQGERNGGALRLLKFVGPP